MLTFHSTNCYARHQYPTFILNWPNETSACVVRDGIYEKSLIEWAAQFLHKDKIFVDIGAHMGTYSILYAPHSKAVYSFEAQRMTYYQLCGGIALSDQSNIYAHNVGLTCPEEAGTTKTLNVISADGGGSTFDQGAVSLNGGKILQSEAVKMMTLDDYRLDDISLIKIDVEGYELNVLKGAQATIARSKPKILFEAWTHPDYAAKKKELFEYLASIHYSITPINGYPFMFLATPISN